MKKILSLVILMVFMFFCLPTFTSADINDEISSLGNQIQALTQEKNLTQGDYDAAVAKLDSIKNQISQLESQIAEKELEVQKGEEALAVQKQLLDERVNSYYKNVNSSSLSLLNLLIEPNLADSLRKFFYQHSLVNQDKDTIIKIVLYIKNLEEIKANLTQQKASLAALKVQVDQQSQALASKIGSLSSQISALVAQQQALIAQRLAALNLPQSAYTSASGCSSDLTNGRDPGFSPGFGFFTFGVPHRVGLNQYGAKGRAAGGQSAQQILQFYYNADYTTGYNDGINIHVAGTNEYGQSIDQTLNIEDYLKHIYEMPTSDDWGMEALKAQAIAARSYALAYTGNGANTICPSQSCQVFKQEENSDRWQQAVDATKGIVLTSGGSPISAYYSSTAGGYVYSSSNSISARPWTKNAQDGSSSYNSFSDVRNNAYDKDSPWFYCDWGARSQYGGTAWLKEDEVADIANVIMLVHKDQSTIAHVYQTDASNPAGTDTWSSDRVKQELKNRGGNYFNSVSSVAISADFGSGKTTSVTITGDAGTQTFSGDDFKTYFDQRAPANIQIVGPLYNVERH